MGWGEITGKTMKSDQYVADNTCCVGMIVLSIWNYFCVFFSRLMRLLVKAIQVNPVLRISDSFYGKALSSGIVNSLTKWMFGLKLL